VAMVKEADSDLANSSPVVASKPKMVAPIPMMLMKMPEVRVFRTCECQQRTFRTPSKSPVKPYKTLRNPTKIEGDTFFNDC
jgi:hypothetical protein